MNSALKFLAIRKVAKPNKRMADAQFAGRDAHDAHPVVRDIENLHLGNVSRVTGKEHASYLPLHTKCIDSENDGVHVVLPKVRENCVGVSIVRSAWIPQRNVYSKESRARSYASRSGNDMMTNRAILRVLDSGAHALFSPLDTHEALISAYVTRDLSDTPFFPAHLHGVQITSDDDSLLKFTPLSNSCDLSDLARNRETTESPLHAEIALVALAVMLAQQRLSLKHMDLHSGNIMWRDPPAGVTRLVVPEFFGPGKHLAIPLAEKGSLPAVIDFGLSSMRTAHTPAVQILRSDYHLLESYDNEEEWGDYTEELRGDEGYDLATFVESLTRDISDLRPQPLQCLRALQLAHSTLGSPQITSEGRPAAKVRIPMRTFLTDFCHQWETEQVQDSDLIVRVHSFPFLPDSPMDSETTACSHESSHELR